MIFALVLGLTLAAVAMGIPTPGVGQFPEIDLVAEEVHKQQQGPQGGSEVLQIINAPTRHDCPKGQKYIGGRCRKVFMVQNKNRRQLTTRKIAIALPRDNIGSDVR